MARGREWVKVFPLPEREAQWQRFKASGHAQRNCDVFFDTMKPDNSQEEGEMILFGAGKGVLPS